MSDPTLTSDTPGAIVVSWEIPSPEPSDYRIDWAKSGEDYTSWRVDEGHVYPAGTETTVTIEGLEAGVEYKVRMRARYHAGDPWSGPWTGDVLIVVAAEGGSIVEVIEPDDTEEPRIAAEQNSPEVLVSNLNLSGGRVTLLLQDSGGVRQSFTTGPNPAGYQISSITLRMRAAFTVNLPGTFNPTVSVIPELSEVAEFTFTAPDGFSGNQRHVFQEATFTAPEDAVLDPNTTYRLQVTNSQSSLNIDNASGDAEESDHGWLIANGLRIIGESLPQGVSVLMAISGEPIPETLISNLKKTAASSATVSTASRAAQSFTTGPGLLGFGYRFDGISVAANLETAGESPSPQMSLYTDENGNPGARLFSLTPPSDFASTATETEYTLTAPSNATLDPGSRYWVVFSNTATDNYQVSTTNDDGEDQDPTPQPGFSIGDGHQTSTGSPPTWADQSQSIRLTVLGGPAWVTDEPADGDFPGSPRTGHRTNGVVSVGTNSAGHLTAGQDIRRLNTGDYWLLDTQPGRSYRLEVTMGTVASQGTGGSAWIEFIDPGDTTTSTCCESDHNRDDSYITVHFEHYQYSPGRRYFVNVTAYDKLAGFGRNSAVYNGPYTITLEDITGVEMVASNLHHATTTLTGDIGQADNWLFVPFTVGTHGAGYKLDRVDILAYPSTASLETVLPYLALHSDSSGSPGGRLCEIGSRIEFVNQIFSPFGWLRPTTMPAASDCAAQTLTAGGTYWLSFANPVTSGLLGALQRTYQVTETGESTYGSGWSIGDKAKKRAGTSPSYTHTDETFTLPMRIWASER